MKNGSEAMQFTASAARQFIGELNSCEENAHRAERLVQLALNRTQSKLNENVLVDF